MDHFLNPHNVGEIENPDGKGIYGSPVCGDMMMVTLSVDENEVITDAKFKTYGCGSAIASSSMATDMIKGMGFSSLSFSPMKALSADAIRLTRIWFDQAISLNGFP